MILLVQNVKAVFDAAIKVVIKPPQKQKGKKKKPSRGCLMSVFFLIENLGAFYYLIVLTYEI